MNNNFNYIILIVLIEYDNLGTRTRLLNCAYYDRVDDKKRGVSHLSFRGFRGKEVKEIKKTVSILGHPLFTNCHGVTLELRSC